MSSIEAPYGLRPVGLIGGQPYAGSVRLIKIASGYAANLFYGQDVKIASDGTVVAGATTTATAATGVAGVFVGCSYTDPNLKYKLFKQYWPTGTVASDAVAYVVDDPDIVMQVQANGSVAATAVGANIALTASAGSTFTGNSQTAADATSVNTTATLPLRIVGFVDGPDSAVGDAYTDILVKWNAPSVNVSGVLIGGHAYNQSTGV
jgi:hypothetical protein